jgi:cytochrome c-type biogenesis protein CcmH/NrfG
MMMARNAENDMIEEEKWRQEVMVFMATISNQMERINNDLYDGTGRAGLVEEFRAYIAEQRGKDAERKMQEKRSDHRWYIVVSLAVIFTALLSLLTYYHMVGR